MARLSSFSRVWNAWRGTSAGFGATVFPPVAPLIKTQCDGAAFSLEAHPAGGAGEPVEPEAAPLGRHLPHLHAVFLARVLLVGATAIAVVEPCLAEPLAE